VSQGSGSIRTMKAGRLSGGVLRAVLAAVRHTPAAGLVVRSLRSDLGVDALGKLPPEARGRLPWHTTPRRARPPREREFPDLGPPRSPAWPQACPAYTDAYRQGRIRPEHVAEQVLARARELAARTPPMGPLLTYDDERALDSARHSGQRYDVGQPRGPLDGIPLAVKEEVDFEGFPTRVGTAWRPDVPAENDSVAVARLRAAGAVLVGQSSMTEYGLSPLGANVHRSLPRNPHDVGCLAGGSSTGSAVAVATGLVPVALGADGGGSIRTPAALCGIFGLKPTYGRIPLSGHGMPWGGSVTHLGPLGASSVDLALLTEICAGPDGADPASEQQPPLESGELLRAIRRGVEGIEIGVVEGEWEDADSCVATAGQAALRALESDGARLRPIRIPLAAQAAALGYVTIGLEALCGLREAEGHVHELGPDVQLLMAGLATFGADEYLDAQRVRETLRDQVAEALRAVDLLALPTTATPAPPVTDAQTRKGFVDSEALNAMCRFAFLANLTGLPAASAPVGTDEHAHPVGLQLIGDTWDEATVLQAVAHLERVGVASVERPSSALESLL
jgi:aspartyl-tRNA(Asn)/glutamyl-tRNA(Gln) amidotransferase subunit A